SPPLRCGSCGKADLRKETDILDVWFDSGCAFAAVGEQRTSLGNPADLYLEGSDQHRGWFQSSLLTSTATRSKTPYRAVLTHGFVVDAEGKKMSKSVGNTVKPERLIQHSGAELVRLWAASSDYREDVRLSEGILKNLSEGYRKIRNTLRYALSNLADFDPAKDAVPEASLLPLDRWAMARLDALVTRVRQAYEDYEFHLVYHAVVDFCGNDLSALHFDISKDRLYTWKRTGHARRSAQTVLHRVLLDVSRLLAPVTSFTSEEVWEHIPGRPAPSVFLAGLPEARGRPDPELMETFERLFTVRSAVQLQLQARPARQSHRRRTGGKRPAPRRRRGPGVPGPPPGRAPRSVHRQPGDAGARARSPHGQGRLGSPRRGAPGHRGAGRRRSEVPAVL